MRGKMKKKNHFLDETIKRTKIENAQKEARDIYNYNEWKNNHDRMVDHELRKLNRKIVNPGKAIMVGILLAILIYIFIILINNDINTIQIALEEIKDHLEEIRKILLELSTIK